MAALNETPNGNRVRIAFFGLRNAGKSTLVNAFTGQPLAIVSDTPGTTTDPVSKAMEILPLGPCLITDTAGLDDDAGALGAMRVRRTLDVLATTDIAVWVDAGEEPSEAAARFHDVFRAECEKRGVVVFTYRRGDDVAALRAKIAAVRLADDAPGLLDGLVSPGDRVVCVCPIDESAPKGRLILPQVQVVRACLDRHVVCTVVQPPELPAALACGPAPCGRTLVITDSQAFGAVRDALAAACAPSVALISFSILFARQKGDLAAYQAGLAAVRSLKDGDSVLIAEGCTHHRQCNDIGSVRIPRALERLSGRKLRFDFCAGSAFAANPADYALIVQCGGCMLTRREVMRRIACARDAGAPVVNYGMVLALAAGVDVDFLIQQTKGTNA